MSASTSPAARKTARTRRAGTACPRPAARRARTRPRSRASSAHASRPSARQSSATSARGARRTTASAARTRAWRASFLSLWRGVQAPPSRTSAAPVTLTAAGGSSVGGALERPLDHFVLDLDRLVEGGDRLALDPLGARAVALLFQRGDPPLEHDALDLEEVAAEMGGRHRVDQARVDLAQRRVDVAGRALEIREASAGVGDDLGDLGRHRRAPGSGPVMICPSAASAPLVSLASSARSAWWCAARAFERNASSAGSTTTSPAHAHAPGAPAFPVREDAAGMDRSRAGSSSFAQAKSPSDAATRAAASARRRFTGPPRGEAVAAQIRRARAGDAIDARRGAADLELLGGVEEIVGRAREDQRGGRSGSRRRSRRRRHRREAPRLQQEREPRGEREDAGERRHRRGHHAAEGRDRRRGAPSRRERASDELLVARGREGRRPVRRAQLAEDRRLAVELTAALERGAQPRCRVALEPRGRRVPLAERAREDRLEIVLGELCRSIRRAERGRERVAAALECAAQSVGFTQLFLGERRLVPVAEGVGRRRRHQTEPGFLLHHSASLGAS